MPFSFLKRKRTVAGFAPSSPFTVDVHAHILPGLDNGPESIEESILLLQEMAAAGVRKIIATPHIMGDYYRNTAATIESCIARIRSELQRKCISVELEAAAEYYLDISLISLLENNQPLLTIADTYLLLETNIVGMPSFLGEAIRLARQRNLVVVLAHPERYHYLQQNFNLVMDLHRQGVLFQVNLGSWASSHQGTRMLAERLVFEGLVSFVGSNAHNLREWNQAHEALRSVTFAKLVEKGLLNQHLL
ncbi:tyrosine-protein phosphatase [Runella aurantiaca]|uniref:protein-tyrosine-phosphatase n=1 Tax=Runella aurantiaca TaxID=2282308 RepID=A0A369IDT0_9BACT|nr:CpsB/CapC family capsule biosynthesis tyrosine phosphatase [Runella aurantiaca]RDB06425.1 capsular biosynthesis protein [Runella aurantiaca]